MSSSDRLATDNPDGAAVPVTTSRGRKAASILAAARQLFLEHGFDAVTMDMVARQAPVSKATLYTHFASKEDLFGEVVVDEVKRINEEVWRVLPDSADVAVVLRRIGEKFLEIFLSRQATLLLRAVISVVSRFPSVGVAMFEAGPKAMADRLAIFLAGANERGVLKLADPHQAAIQFFSVVRGDLDIRCMLLPEARPSRAEQTSQIEAAVEMFLHFYGAKGVAQQQTSVP